MLKLLLRLLQLVLFVLLLAFALKNTSDVSLKFFQNWEWQAPLILVLLLTLVLGALLGVLACTPLLISQRRALNLFRQRHAASSASLRGPRIAPDTELPNEAPPADHVRF